MTQQQTLTEHGGRSYYSVPAQGDLPVRALSCGPG
jgi:hypothetical protein